MSLRNVIASIGGKEYTLACDSGQEQHLTQLVTQFNARAEQLTKSVGKLSEPLLLIYTALMVADELFDANREIARVKDELARTARQLIDGDDAKIAALEEGMAESLQALAQRIEGIADKLSAA